MNAFLRWNTAIWLIMFGNMLIFTIPAIAEHASITQTFEYTSEQDKQAIHAIATILTSGRNKTDEILQKIGFTKIAITIPDFTKWPALRQIETGYLSAVAAGGEAEGFKFLQAISMEIAENYSNAIRYEPALNLHFSATTGTSELVIRFAYFQQNQAPPQDPHVREAIRTVARYVNTVPGGMISAIAQCCHLSMDESYDILRSSSSNHDALQRAIDEGHPPPELKGRLLRLIKIVAESSHAVFYQTTLDPYLTQIDSEFGKPSGLVQLHMDTSSELQMSLEKTLNESDEKIRLIISDAAHRAGVDVKSAVQFMPNTNLPTPFVSTSNTSGTNIEIFKAITRSVIKPPEDTVSLPNGPGGLPRFSFYAMRFGAHGFGGVVFGSPVDGTQVDNPTKLFWVYDVQADSPDDDWGHFDVVLGTKSVASTRRFHSADAYAAWEIVTGRKGVFAPIDVAHGEGVGLASVNNNGSPTPMVVHPAIYGLAIGDSAALTDAIGFLMSNSAFLRQLRDAGISEQIIEKANTWHTTKLGYYKITDTPLIVKYNDGILRVSRSDDTDYDHSLKAVAFLDIQGFQGSQPMPSESLPFYETVPSLITVFPAFDRLNSFSELLALMRWASASNAAIMPPVSPIKHTAKIYIYKLSNGEIVQHGQPLSADQLKTLESNHSLNLLRKNAEYLKATLHKTGANNPALSCIDVIAAIKSRNILINLANSKIRNQPELNDEQRTAIMSKILDNDESYSNAKLHTQKCSSRAGMLTLALEPEATKQLTRLHSEFDISTENYQKSRNIAYQTYGRAQLPIWQKIVSLPDDKEILAKNAVRQLQQNYAWKEYETENPAKLKIEIYNNAAVFKELKQLLSPPGTTATENLALLTILDGIESTRLTALKDKETMISAKNALTTEEKKIISVWLGENRRVFDEFWRDFEKFLNLREPNK